MCTTAEVPSAKSDCPSANDVPTTGSATGAPSVPLTAAVRPSVPLLKMSTPEAPAASAFCSFAPNVQVPRWMSAIRPGTNPAKSAASQPLVLVRLGVAVVSTACTAAVTSPPPENVIVWKSVPLMNVRGVGATCAS
jgi:hypothetical protein